MASDSSASTTPMVLTPDSTGSSPDSRRSRRQAAFYPNVNAANKNVKPFSRSAAKRESVMALGSIEHLQHYFTKAGIASKKDNVQKAQYGLVPAIGGKGHVPSAPSAGTLAEFNLPPSPPAPFQPLQVHQPYVKADDLDPDNLLPGVCLDLSAVAHAWRIGEDIASVSQPVDVLDILKGTTRAIRSVRNYLLSLPSESTGTIRVNFRSAILGPSKPNPTSKNRSDPLTRIRRSALEVLAMLRVLEEKCRLPLSDDAYDAQSDGAGSRGESHSRLTSPNIPAADLPLDEQRVTTPDSLKPDPDASFTYSLVQVNGRYQQVPVWEDEDDGLQVEEEEEKEKRERWDERLVLAGGWLYKQDVHLTDLQKERAVVEEYLNLVDEIIFETQPGTSTEKGWERERRKFQSRPVPRSRSKGRRVSAGDGEGRSFGASLGVNDGGKRRVSTGMIDIMQSMTLTEEPEGMENIEEAEEETTDPEELEDDLLPEWARRNTFVDDDLGRAHAVLANFLPKDLLAALHPPDSPSAFFESVSSGQLLCVAYNAIVRRSKKPWGYISKDGIHDILALEKANEGADNKGWTFRRTDNLRLWAGALKLRYDLPLQMPSQDIKTTLGMNVPPSFSTSTNSRNLLNTSSSNSSEPAIYFDARVIARKEGDWQNMLKAILIPWIRKVVDERCIYH